MAAIVLFAGSDAVFPELAQLAQRLEVTIPGGARVLVAPQRRPLNRENLLAAVAQQRSVVLVQDASARDDVRRERLYHFRYLWVFGVSSIDEAARDIAQNFVDGQAMRFVSTRGGGTSEATFLSVIREGLAPDGGLYVPTKIPRLPASLRYHLAHGSVDYRLTCLAIFERLADRSEVPPGVLAQMITSAYHPERWSGREDVCPLTPLGEGVFMLELFHGPTAAFKDFALQLFPHLFALATSGDQTDYMILAATSGDTGVAAISGFMNAAPETRVMVLYPHRGVSPVQQTQMISCDGGAVRVYGVHSNFDFCQTTVKHIFNDTAIEAVLREKHNVALSSANSINWGRLAPQIVYYFHAYGELVRAGVVRYGEAFDVAVPTGNFGNILSAYVAMLMGLPVRRFVLASNENDVLFEFITTGVYDITTKTLTPTMSPSIDILKASNIERFIYLLSNGDAIFVKACMEDLNTKRRFELPQAMRETLHQQFWASRCDEATCREVIAATFSRSGKKRVVDPHTAVALHVVNEYHEHIRATGGERRPIVVASTAHWAKFPGPVLQSLAPAAAQAATDASSSCERSTSDTIAYVQGVFDEMQKIAGPPATTVAPPLAAALAKAAACASKARDAPADEAHIRHLVVDFASQQNQSVL